MDNTIKLTTGAVIELSPIPARIRDIIDGKYPMPDAPIVESTAATGEIIKMAIEDDPEYLAECARIEALRNAAWQEAYTLAGLKKIQVPDSFDIEAAWGDELRYLDPDWQPRPGKIGRKLDYIEFELLANSADAVKVSDKINEIMGIDLGVADSIEDSFPGDIQAEAD